MKNIDFNFFDDADNNELSKTASELFRIICKQKHDLINIAILEIEGKHPTKEEIKKYGMRRLMQSPLRFDNQFEEVIYWKNKPIIGFKPVDFMGKPVQVEYEFLYQ